MSVGPGEAPTDVPQPEDIYRRTKEEGGRRLERPALEVLSTAVAAGFDIAGGLTALALVGSQIEPWVGRSAQHVFASIGFGSSFAFLVAGRGELFTENFLVPIAGLDHRSRGSWLGLLRLWTISPIANILGGALVVVILTVHGVLPHGTARTIVSAADTVHANGYVALFFSAVFAGALMTAMTWFVEGQRSMLVRIVIAWTVGTMIALGYFDHVIVETLELAYGMRFGAPVPVSFLVANVGIAFAGNIAGGIGLVTLNRLTQGRQGERKRSSA
ncbi:MAG TPA: formate/nitrite transporter family protein [Gaiellaceae bacterium]|nr:formate/nitrite transporter family protein [Gaiellaceae bacterium]